MAVATDLSGDTFVAGADWPAVPFQMEPPLDDPTASVDLSGASLELRVYEVNAKPGDLPIFVESTGNGNIVVSGPNTDIVHGEFYALVPHTDSVLLMKVRLRKVKTFKWELWITYPKLNMIGYGVIPVLV